MKKIFSLLMVAMICLFFILIRGYLNEWEVFRTSYQNYYYPLTGWEEFLSSLFLFIPVIFIGWMLWVNGKEKVFQRLSMYLVLFVTYIVIPVSILIGIVLIEEYLGINLTPFQNKYGAIAFFILVTTVWNYLLTRVEGLKLSPKNLLLLLFSCVLVPFFTIGWTIFLQLFVSGSFVEDELFNGGFVFAFILYEGTYFLWLKSKLRFT